MMSTEPGKLFSEVGTQALPDHPALNGGHCKACGNVFFPMQSYGCEICGSTELEPKALTGRGEILASAIVYMPVGDFRKPPFRVGSIRTDEGAILRALLAIPPETDLEPGTKVVSILVDETRQGHGDKDLWFTLETGKGRAA